MKVQAVVAVVLAAVGAGVWWSAGRERREPVDPAPALVTGEPPATGETLRLAPDEVPVREAVAVEVPPAHEPAEVAPVPVPPSVSGRCVDELLVPLPRVHVLALDALAVEAHEPPTCSTRSDGAFALTLPGSTTQATLRFEVTDHAVAFVDVRLSAGETSLGDVILAPGGSVRGRVLGPDGAAFPGAEVAVTPPALPGGLERARVEGPVGTRHPRGISGPDGRFEIQGVGVGPARVWASAAGMRHAISPPVEVAARRTTDGVELRLEPEHALDRIQGLVLAPDGSPVARAGISGMERNGGGGGSLSLATDAEGRFELEAKPGFVYDLEATDPEGRWSRVSAEAVVPGTDDLVLAFHEARRIPVQVRAPDGSPVESWIASTEKADGSDTIEWVRRPEHPGGREELLVPDEPFLILIDARGFAPARKGPFSPEDPPGALTIELVPEPGVRGIVLANGEPVAGARVTLHAQDPRSRIEHQGFPCILNPRARDSDRTEGDGHFVLKLRQAGAFFVRASLDGFADAEVGPLELLPGVGARDLVLTLGEGGALEGHVLFGAGRDPAGVIVAINRGDGHARTVRSDERGFFRFEGLMAGPWHLTRGQQEVGTSVSTSYSSTETPTVLPFNCEIREGETTVRDLDLRRFEPCTLQGTLLVNGQPAKGWSIVALPGDRSPAMKTPPSTATADDGTFSFRLEEVGELGLSLAPPAEDGGQGSIELRTVLHPGTNPWRADLAMGRLSGRCATRTEAQTLYYVRRDEAPTCWLPIVVGEGGHFALPFVPAGPGRVVQIVDEHGDPRTIELATVDVPAGGERTLELP